jgi:hypothetical protein
MTEPLPTNDARLDNALARLSDADSIVKGALEQVKLAYHDFMRKDSQRELLARHEGDCIRAAQEIDPTLAILDTIEGAASSLGKAARAAKKMAARAQAGITDHYEETLTEADRLREEAKANGRGPLFRDEEPASISEELAAAQAEAEPKPLTRAVPKEGKAGKGRGKKGRG